VNFTDDFTQENIRKIILDYPRINLITFFESENNSYDDSSLNNGMGRVVFTKKTYNKKQVLKIRNENDLTINIKFFTESLQKNVFFNKKVYLSAIGEIKNSPYSEIVFGNIQENNLEQVINQDDFKILWNVKKDSMDVCKDCELRYCCNDNRNPKQRNEDQWYFEEECNYNPYINKWDFEEKYMNLINSGVKSSELGFIINHNKLEKSLKTVWE
jgi:radical SAM protein with 4Fe4S-binding SPASM domain